MVDPSVLVDNLVAMLRDIQDLVLEMGGDPERIYAYHDQYPKQSSLAHAIHQMPAPSIMAVWQGTGPGSFGGMDVWKHQVTLYLRARETFDGDPPTAYYRLFRLITKGVPDVGRRGDAERHRSSLVLPDGSAHDPAADRCRGAGLFRSSHHVHGDWR